MAEHDGGRAAISGFLAQTIAIAGIAVLPRSLPDTNRSDQGNKTDDLLLALFSKGGSKLWQETFDTDLVMDLKDLGLQQADELVLVQFKFSETGKTIGPTELEHIKKRFQDSGRRAKKELDREVTRYILVTNRRIPSLPDSRRSSRATPIHVTIGIELDGRPFHVAIRPLDYWNDALTRFARSYGCLDDEIDAGLDRLVGELLSCAIAPIQYPITIDQLARAFTGITAPKQLTAEAIAAVEGEKLRFTRDVLGVRGDLVERQIVHDLLEVVETRAIALLTGLGGMGKTVALWSFIQHIWERVEAKEQVIGVMRQTDEVQPHYFKHLACGWANDVDVPRHRAGDDDPDRVLKRLSCANPKARSPLLFLALDGIDEYAPNQRDAAIDLIRWFTSEDQRCRRSATPPQAALILTCRDVNDFLMNWHPGDLSGYGPSLEDQPPVIPLGIFEDSELRSATFKLAPEVAKRLAGRLVFEDSSTRAIPLGSDGYGKLGDGSGPTLPRASLPASDAIADESVQLLHHPVFWRAFLGLDTTWQARLLDGDEAALVRLAAEYFERTCRKARRRGINVANLNAIGNALHGLAKHCRASGEGVYDYAIWVQFVRASGALHPNDDGALYQEALSAGLIASEAETRWRWTYPFVRNYIADRGGNLVYRSDTEASPSDEGTIAHGTD
ncbi:MAG: hypothetical protein ACRDID_21660 [Ktedonobacterales bacterium]